MNYNNELEESIRFLNSPQAIEFLENDAYWPKWDSPWWHMLLLHEMGEAKQIPENVIHKYVESLNRIPLKIFPIQPEDMPEGVDPYTGSPCHCQLGNVYQVLAAWGLDVDKELPWIRPWFLRYQMSDGGLNCDNNAYLEKDECPSSMVGTIAAFESILLYTPRAWTTEEQIFLDKGARFLMERKLMHGSQTKHNADERESAKDWTKLCFPRFYLYDTLRGLSALLIYAEMTKQPLLPDTISDVVNYIKGRFPDGMIRNERYSFDGVGTLLPTNSGEWLKRQPATFFPLLTKVSEIGAVSPFLTNAWAESRRRILQHHNLGHLL